MRTFSDVIDDLGGYLAVAEAIAVPKGTASAMKTRQSIPSEYWDGLVTLARRLGRDDVTFEVLAEISAQRRAHARRSQPGSPTDEVTA
ncbi:carph-isopro domain-containing protein [Lichenifustis flavocetrariae]|uniref:Uncharacterized protein n=1 Tax=Lichenifustis flavocetrariae TaxID=2949735 RepID=A0AA41YZ65_9HYPH|nr:hypothetical protein [Lichenifustis flavocetrariae]MCW6509793.1 hypothetical protein [Lichenifustis flavocetrariae]